MAPATELMGAGTYVNYGDTQKVKLTNKPPALAKICRQTGEAWTRTVRPSGEKCIRPSSDLEDTTKYFVVSSMRSHDFIGGPRSSGNDE